MNYLDIVNEYYKAWVEKDIGKLNTLLNEEQFGIRNFFEDVLFSTKSIEKEFRKFTISSFELSEVTENNNILYCKILINYEFNKTLLNASTIVKFVFDKNKILKVYETLEKPKLTRVKCIVSYDGSIFRGFQIQPDLRTVQGDIEKGLKFLTGEDIVIHPSGRTDKGVHALNQVFHFDTLSQIKPENFWRVLNSYLPDSIYIKSSSKVHQTFHSRYDVLSKEYMYVINFDEYNPIKRNYEWFVQDFDFEKLSSELNKLVGLHDFTSFTKTDEDKEKVRRILDVKLKKTDTHLYISIIGKGFLRYMVRYLVGTLIEIAKGNVNQSILDFIDMKNPSEITWKAPSGGLYLKEVVYYE